MFVPHMDQYELLRMGALAAKWKEPPRDALDTLVLTTADLPSLDVFTQVHTLRTGLVARITLCMQCAVCHHAWLHQLRNGEINCAMRSAPWCSAPWTCRHWTCSRRLTRCTVHHHWYSHYDCSTVSQPQHDITAAAQ